MLANFCFATLLFASSHSAPTEFPINDVFLVFVYALITAIATGLGVLPFVLFKNVGRRSLGFGNAAASGLMLGASIGLIWEATQISIFKMLIGLVAGFLLIWLARVAIPASPKVEEQFANPENQSGNFGKILLIMVVMTIHSFAEGVGIGVSFGGREGFGELVSIAIALHNVPEGLAIGLVMIPRGVSVRKAMGWSIFSSLPQPLMAVPAFLFVNAFQAFLPIGLAIAAGAMLYMIYRELLPEATRNLSKPTVYACCLVTAVAMLVAQLLMT